MRWMISNLFKTVPIRYGHTYFFPMSVITLGSALLELCKGMLILPLLEHTFHLPTLWALALSALSLAVCLWSPIEPKTIPAAMVVGLLLAMHSHIALLTLILGLFIFAALAKPVSAALVSLCLYPLLNWSFIPNSHYPALGLAIAGLAYAKWWSVARLEQPVHELS